MDLDFVYKPIFSSFITNIWVLLRLVYIELHNILDTNKYWLKF